MLGPIFYITLIIFKWEYDGDEATKTLDWEDFYEVK